MELVDLGAALVDDAGQPASGLRGLRRGARGRRPGQGDRRARAGRRDAPRDRRADRAARAVRGQGPCPPRARAGRRGPRRRSRSSSATTGSSGIVAAAGAERGRPRPHRRRRAEVTADVLGRLRVELGDRLGLADPDVLAYCWVHRFPMYQWDAENGRWDATHNPFSGVVPEDEALLTTARGDLGQAVAGRPGRPRPGAPVRHRPQRLGARRRLGPDPPPRPARAELRRSRARPTTGCGRSSARSSTRSSTARRRTAGSPSASIAGRAPRQPDEHPRGHGVPQDAVGHRPDARGAVAAGAGPVRRARPPVRRRAGPGRLGVAAVTDDPGSEQPAATPGPSVPERPAVLCREVRRHPMGSAHAIRRAATATALAGAAGVRPGRRRGDRRRRRRTRRPGPVPGQAGGLKPSSTFHDTSTLAPGIATPAPPTPAALVTGLLFGMVPAFQSTKGGISSTLKESGRGALTSRAGSRMRTALVITEVALAVTLLAGAGLLIRSFSKLAAVDPGFPVQPALTFEVTLPGEPLCRGCAADRVFRPAAAKAAGAARVCRRPRP